MRRGCYVANSGVIRTGKSNKTEHNSVAFLIALVSHASRQEQADAPAYKPSPFMKAAVARFDSVCRFVFLTLFQFPMLALRGRLRVAC